MCFHWQCPSTPRHPFISRQDFRNNTWLQQLGQDWFRSPSIRFTFLWPFTNIRSVQVALLLLSSAGTADILARGQILSWSALMHGISFLVTGIPSEIPFRLKRILRRIFELNLKFFKRITNTLQYPLIVYKCPYHLLGGLGECEEPSRESFIILRIAWCQPIVTATWRSSGVNLVWLI